MSHEGIRFISEEEAHKLAQETAHRDLPKEATEPARVRVEKTTGTGMEIDWKDGHQSRWNFTWLRDACPCATCHEERGATVLVTSAQSITALANMPPDLRSRLAAGLTLQLARPGNAARMRIIRHASLAMGHPLSDEATDRLLDASG